MVRSILPRPNGLMRSALPTVFIAMVASIWIWAAASYAPAVTLQFSRVDNALNDQWVRARSLLQKADPQIVIIDIDENSLAKMEPEVGRWPWPRSVHGFLLQGLKRAGARAVVFDLMFAERDLYRPQADAFFNEALADAPPVFFAALLLNHSPSDTQLSQSMPESVFWKTTGIAASPKAAITNTTSLALLLPHAIKKKYWHIGLINFDGDADGVARNYQLLYPVERRLLPSLPATIARALFDRSNLPQKIRLNYKGKGLIPYPHLSYVDALQLLTRGDDRAVNRDYFQGKIIIVGTSASGLHDLRSTPIAPLQPAFSILATAIDNIKNHDAYQPLPGFLSALAGLIAILAAGYALRRDNFRWALASTISITLAAGLMVLWSGKWVVNAGYIPEPGTTLVLIGLAVFLLFLTRGLSEYSDRRKATSIFQRFMDPQVVTQLMQQDWQQAIATRSSEISILFSDIRGFTTLSESRSAEEIIDLLNQYFDNQVEAVFEHSGTLDKFIGDALMAFWGAPLANSQHAVQAISAALDMSDNLEKFRCTLGPEFGTFEIGIGIHSGHAVVGMLGSSRRYDYTAIGDAVNLASRIEGLTKDRCRILVSDATRQAALGHFEFNEVGEFQVKGRQQPVRLFEPKQKIMHPGGCQRIHQEGKP